VSDGSNVWFFIVAVDTQGNFDREPEADSGAFEYYQQPSESAAPRRSRPRSPAAPPAGT